MHDKIQICSLWQYGNLARMAEAAFAFAFAFAFTFAFPLALALALAVKNIRQLDALEN